MRKISKRRQEMGEEAWAEYQRKRKNAKATVWKRKRSWHVVDCRQKKKRKLIEYKGGECEKCGYNKDCPGAYHFHHLRNKEFTVSKVNLSLTKMLLEVDKCQLLCANCHAETHQEEYKQKRNSTVL